MITYSLSKTFVHGMTLNLTKDENFLNKKVYCLLPPTLYTKTNIESMPKEDTSTWVQPDSLAEITHMLT